MTHFRKFLVAAIIPLTFVGCKRSEATSALPPAEGPGAPPLPSAPKIDSAETQSSSSERVLRATGTTNALHQAELGPKGSGVLAAVMVDEGSKVKKGQPLFRLESTNPMLQVRQAEAGLAQARVSLSRAELDYNRMKPLLEQGAISQANWDAVRIGYDQAQVGVQQAQAAVASSKAYASDTLVVAPFDGIVTSKKKNAGETVTMMPPTTVIVLQDLSKIEIRVRLAESALTRIKPGEPMQVRFNSLNLEKSVSIDRINPAVDPMSRTVEIVGVLPNPDRLLKAGMLVEVTFPNTAVATPAAASPSAAAAAIPSNPTQSSTAPSAEQKP